MNNTTLVGRITKDAEVKALEKNPSEDITKFYTNLSIRPLKFVASLNESYDGLVLVQGQPSLKSNVSKGK
jgi:hypothetical protein